MNQTMLLGKQKRPAGRDRQLYEQRLRVMAYMQAEDTKKAEQAFGRWLEAVRAVDDGGKQ